MSTPLSSLENASRSELTALWEYHHKSVAPMGISSQLLKLSAAYYQQDHRSRGKARRIDNLLIHSTVKSSPIMEPGSLLVREWHGQTYRVEVLDNGFQMNGRTFRSLSEVARFITGARWSGPRFFGLGNTP